MTEFGMAITNSYRGSRIPGAVGIPFSDVQARIVYSDENGKPDYDRYIVNAEGDQVEIASDYDGVLQGELLIKTPSLFQEYWGKPDATKDTYHKDWFITGDVASYENGVFRIVGRSSVDIIKSGGYKIGALDIEATLL